MAAPGRPAGRKAPRARVPAPLARAASSVRWSDVRGLNRLAGDATLGIVGIVESMHRTIASLAPPLGSPRTGGTRGITGLVYRSVRGVTRVVSGSVDALLAPLAEGLDHDRTSPEREAALSVLNGLIGDRLAADDNPLALPMRILHRGVPLPLAADALAAAMPDPAPHVVLLVHGLCMGPGQWQRNGHDHGAALARDLGATTVYLHYNTGRHISENGRELAALLDALLRAWPTAAPRLSIVAHSMGGLVARSACHYAQEAGQPWLQALDRIVFLSTPHTGAPLERAGTFADLLLAVSPYSAPFARLGLTRSAGVRDLGHAALRDEDWQRRGAGLPLPEHVRAYALAACRAEGRSRAGRLVGDGLVPVASALGWSRDPARALGLPATRQRVLHGLGHFDLLDHPEAYHTLIAWMTDDAPE